MRMKLLYTIVLVATMRCNKLFLRSWFSFKCYSLGLYLMSGLLHVCKHTRFKLRKLNVTRRFILEFVT